MIRENAVNKIVIAKTAQGDVYAVGMCVGYQEGTHALH